MDLKNILDWSIVFKKHFLNKTSRRMWQHYKESSYPIPFNEIVLNLNQNQGW